MTDTPIHLDSEITTNQFNPEQYIKDAGMKIIHPKDYALPSIESLDLSRISDPRDREDVILTLKQMFDYISRPIITDGNKFKDNNEREAWTTKAEEEIKMKHGPKASSQLTDTLRRNKLKRNSVTSIAGWLNAYYITDHLPESPTNSVISNIRKMELQPDKETGRMVDPWDELPLEEKIQTVNDISDSMADIIKSFKKS